MNFFSELMSQIPNMLLLSQILDKQTDQSLAIEIVRETARIKDGDVYGW